MGAALFERHKLLFALNLATSLAQVPAAQLAFLASGGSSLAATPSLPNPAPEWLPSPAWSQLCHLAQSFPVPFASLPTHVAASPDAWRPWVVETAAEALPTAPLPDTYDSALSLWQRLLLIRTLRPDAVMHGARELVRRELGWVRNRVMIRVRVRVTIASGALLF